MFMARLFQVSTVIVTKLYNKIAMRVCIGKTGMVNTGTHICDNRELCGLVHRTADLSVVAAVRRHWLVT